MSKQSKLDAYHALIFSAGLVLGHCLVEPVSIKCVILGITAASLYLLASKITAKLI